MSAISPIWQALFLSRGAARGDLGATRGGYFESAGRQWRTEWHTKASGRGACRSYLMTTVSASTPKPSGGYAFSQSNECVFNSVVLFDDPSWR